MDNIVYCAVKALICDGDKCLMLKQNVDGTIFWDLPGGRVEFGENPYEALIREVKEEASIDVTIVKPLGLWWFFRKKDGHQVVCSTFLCSVENTDVNIHQNPVQESIESAEWVSKADLRSNTIGIQTESLAELLKNIE